MFDPLEVMIAPSLSPSNIRHKNSRDDRKKNDLDHVL